MRKRTYRKVLLLLAGLLSLGLFVMSPKSAQAANPATMNFQGKVVNADGTNVTNGSYSFVFRIYDTASPTTTGTCASNASCWWEETDSLTVTNGVFQVELGAVCAFSSACTSSHSGINFNTNNALYLTMKFNSDAAGFMSPTVHLTSVPYAFNADNLGGIAASGFIQNTTSTQSSSDFHISGNGQADTQLQAPTFDAITSNTTLGIGTTNASVITIGNTTNSTVLFKTKSSATAFQVQNAGGASLLNVDTTGMGQLTLAPAASAYDDEFNTGGPTAGAQWTPYTATGTSYAVNPSSSGTLRFTADTANHDCFPSTGLNCAWLAETPPSGNFQMDEKIVTTVTDVQAPGMMAYQDSNNYLRFEYEYENSNSDYEVKAHQVINGIGTPDIIPYCTVSTQPVYLRVNKTNSVWTLSYSTNGTTYTVCGSFSAPLNLAAGTAFIGPSYNGGTGAAAGSFDIDYFRITTDQATLNNTGTTLFKPTVDSVTAFQIQSGGTGNTLLSADTSNMRVGIGTSVPSYMLDVAGSIGAYSLTLASTSAYTNEFNSSTNPGWSFSNGIADSSTADVNTTAPGELNFTPNPATTQRDCWTSSLLQCLRYLEAAPSGDFQADTKIDTTPGSSQALGIFAYQDATHFIRFEYSGPGGGTGSVTAWLINGASGTGPLTCSTVPSAPIYLRVIRTGNNWYMYYSTNGSSYTQCGTSFSAAFTLASIGLHLDNSTTNSFTAGNFDYFRVIVGSATSLTSKGNSLFQTSLDSTTAFQVQNSGGNSLFTVDTANNQVLIAASAATTADQLAITNASGATSTTGVNGASINFNTTGSTASADNAGLRIDVTSNNSGAGTTLEGLKIGDLSSPEANSTQTGLSVATGWDIGLDLQSGGIQLADMGSNPPPPTTGNLRLYAKNIAGRMMLKAEGSSGVDYPLQPSFFQNQISMISNGGGTSCVAAGFNGVGLSITGLATSNTCSSQISESLGYTKQIQTAATTGIGSYVYSTDAFTYRGSISNGHNGFFFNTRVAFPNSTATYTGNWRTFLGMTDRATTVPTATDNPAGVRVGFSFANAGTGRSDTNWQISTRDGSTETLTDTGLPFTGGKVYDVYLYCPVQCTSIYWRIDNVNDQTSAQDISTGITGTLPTASTAMRPYFGQYQTAAAAHAIQLNRMYIESDR